jgi:hypothetical protein
VRNSVSTGIISSLIDVEGAALASSTASTSTSSTREIIGLMTNTNLSDSIPGGPLLNLYGETVGIRVSTNISDKFTFLPVNILKQGFADEYILIIKGQDSNLSKIYCVNNKCTGVPVQNKELAEILINPTDDKLTSYFSKH